MVAAGDSLEAFPNRGRPGSHKRRELPSVPPYVIRYPVAGEDVMILTVKHGARRPD
ncbi:type II toxin-antitoxin system RelE/ParE family toxin [Sphingomonas sp. HF-S4]|uniref:Type II toxin-antitoxin system RelE/ParE family toxin n=1 Tax=Sphingomonas agrestis TaxID=3080540 RepID=A0ABU3YA76_9SPHN|nr:type II toxin-antitoxin system RelE/ParE family toxin [Sphingomonas sp. HF-S4]MDV3458308.1 type II toxin-antitoxin system RelE/ParE family toxin [Sphingomonas sp. HF-S4]